MTGRVTVGIIGAGPAGLLLGNLLLAAGVDCAVFERRSRAHIEQRARAGLIAHPTVELLKRHGLADRLLADGTRHTACEFRHRGERFSVPYSDLAGGRAHYVYPQQFLVRDLVAAFLRAGGTLHFDTACTALRRLRGPGPAILCTTGPAETARTRCDYIAGCDGQHGVSPPALPPGHAQTYRTLHPAGWLAVLAQAPPATTEIIYGLHRDGFAGHMLRTPQVSRFYLQCPAGDDPDNWPDERIWAQLHHRLALRDSDWHLNTGPILDKHVLDLRSCVTSPMQYGKLYLVGDAAHVISPAGAKGMNLAIADAAALAAGITDSVHRGNTDLLDRYSALRLPSIRRAQEFSHWLLQLLHTTTDTGPGADFALRLRLARLRQLRDSRTCAAAFAENYVGMP
ncbi:4-hydroxybenzoate 3-monooxygenase [Streptomyces sp. NPDC054863]